MASIRALEPEKKNQTISSVLSDGILLQNVIETIRISKRVASFYTVFAYVRAGPSADMFHEVSDISQSFSLSPRGGQSPSLSPIIGLSLCSPVHLVLLGDSTLDNNRHVTVSIDMLLSVECARMGWQFTFLAQDGANLDDVSRNQLPHIPESATHVVLSVSGNDLLRLLNELSANSFAFRSVYEAVTARLDETSFKSSRSAVVVIGSTAHFCVPVLLHCQLEYHH